jgi:hypothetical protein
MSPFPRFAAACLAGALVLAPVADAGEIGIVIDPSIVDSVANEVVDCAIYFVRIKTGDIKDGNSDGLPFIEIHGSEGETTGPIFLLDRGKQRPANTRGGDSCVDADGNAVAWVTEPKNRPNAARKFERGSADGFMVKARNVGTPTDITLGVSAANVAFSAKWFVATVYVIKAQCSDDSCVFTDRLDDPAYLRDDPWDIHNFLGVYYDWVDIDATHRVALDRDYDETVPVNVSIQTAGEYYSGTDADITLRIDGETWDNEPFTWEGPINPLIDGHPFESGHQDKFKIYGLAKINKVNAVTLKSAHNNGLSPDWEPAWVDVQSPEACGAISLSTAQPGEGYPCERGKPERFYISGWLDDHYRVVTKVATSLSVSESDAISHDAALKQQEIWLNQLVALCKQNPECDAAVMNERQMIDAMGTLPAESGQPADVPEAAAEPDAKSELEPEPQPASEPTPAVEPAEPDGGTMSEEERCRGMVDGRVAYDREGHTAWNAGNIELLCRGATSAEDRIACFEAGIADHGDWGRAIAECQQSDDAPPSRAEPSEPEAGPVAEPEPSAPEPMTEPAAGAEPDGNGACEVALEDQCKALLQDQVPWTNRNADDPSNRHWQPTNLDALCGCTDNPAATVQCFQNELAGNGDSWSDAIETCRAP